MKNAYDSILPTPHDNSNGFENLPLVLRIDDLMALLGIGRNSAYDLVHSNQIRVIRIGKQIRIPREEVIRFLSCAT